jgi:uncharacterized membrane protein YhaH (DUF805 family)
MDFRHVFSRGRRPISLPIFGIWLVWLPLSVINLSDSWGPHLTATSLCWLVVTLVYAVTWPFIAAKRLSDLGRSLLWILPILLPLGVLMLALCERWLLTGAVALLVSLAAQAPLLWLSPRKGPVAVKDEKADRPNA